MELIRDDVKIEWEALGEGLNGDYNPMDPNDMEFLRFYVSVLRDGVWEEKEDASYCTCFPATATPEEQMAGLEVLMKRFHHALHGNIDVSVKKLGEEMSWIGLDAINRHLYVPQASEPFEPNYDDLIADLKDQLQQGKQTTELGEPQAWVELENGRSIEVTLEQHGLEGKGQFYSVRLHCNQREYENNDFSSTNGVIDCCTTFNSDIHELDGQIRAAISCSESYPIAKHSLEAPLEPLKPSLLAQIEAAVSRLPDKSSGQQPEYSPQELTH